MGAKGLHFQLQQSGLHAGRISFLLHRKVLENPGDFYGVARMILLLDDPMGKVSWCTGQLRVDFEGSRGAVWRKQLNVWRKKPGDRWIFYFQTGGRAPVPKRGRERGHGHLVPFSLATQIVRRDPQGENGNTNDRQQADLIGDVPGQSCRRLEPLIEMELFFHNELELCSLLFLLQKGRKRTRPGHIEGKIRNGAQQAGKGGSTDPGDPDSPDHQRNHGDCNKFTPLRGPIGIVKRNSD